MREIIISNKDNLDQTVRTIDKLATEGSKNPFIIEAAEACGAERDVLHCVFDFAYNSAVFRATPFDRQQLRTVANVLRTHYANCTGYVTIIAAMLKYLRIPFTYRCVGMAKNKIQHIYILSQNKVLDCTIGQAQDGNDSYSNRPPNGQFNREISFPVKIDFKSNMLTVLQGNRLTQLRYRNQYLEMNRLARKRLPPKVNLDGISPALIGEITDKLPQIIAAGKEAFNFVKNLVLQIFGDPCKRGCDFKHLSNKPMRQACKAECERAQEAETIEAYNYALSLMTAEQRQGAQKAGFLGMDLKTVFLFGVGATVVYLVTRDQ